MQLLEQLLAPLKALDLLRLADALAQLRHERAHAPEGVCIRLLLLLAARGAPTAISLRCGGAGCTCDGLGAAACSDDRGTGLGGGGEAFVSCRSCRW